MTDELNTTLTVHGYHPQHGALVSATDVEKLMEPIIADTSSLKDSFLEQHEFSKSMGQRVKSMQKELERLEGENKRNNELLGECWIIVGNDVDFEHGGFSTICEHVNAVKERADAGELRVAELERDKEILAELIDRVVELAGKPVKGIGGNNWSYVFEAHALDSAFGMLIKQIRNKVEQYNKDGQ